MGTECVDGKWRFTGYDAWQVERPVFLPVYKFRGSSLEPYSVIEDQPYDRWGNRYVGRVCVDGAMGGEGQDREVGDEYIANCGPTDILQWPLYYGGPHQYARGAGTSARLPTYAKNLARLPEVADRVEGILLGNCGAELAFHHLMTEATEAQRQWCIRKCLDFMRETGDLVKAAGGTPCWGPMDREVLMHAYHAEGEDMGTVCDEYGGWLIVFAEWALFPKPTCLYGDAGSDGIWYDGEDEPHPEHQNWRDDYGVFVAWERREAAPYRRLLDWMHKHRVMYSIGYNVDWVQNKADQILTFYGAKALVY